MKEARGALEESSCSRSVDCRSGARRSIITSSTSSTRFNLRCSSFVTSLCSPLISQVLFQLVFLVTSSFSSLILHRLLVVLAYSFLLQLISPLLRLDVLPFDSFIGSAAVILVLHDINLAVMRFHQPE